VILIVGGHSRNIGKTSVVAGLIAALPAYDWTAIKITQFGHGVCSSSGEDCECATDPDHPFALTRETGTSSGIDKAGTDTARYLRAGARESLWLRTRAGELGFAMPALRRVIDRARDVIIESNSVMQFLRPDAYLVVLDPAISDFKLSSRLYLDRADAFLVSEPRVPAGGETLPVAPVWPAVAPRLLRGRPVFRLGAGFTPGSDLLRFVESRRKVPLSASR
jgi:molybdopterin-guanine dinucleotide biosynthesis protein